MQQLPEIGSVVRFGKRRGYVVGYTTVKRMSHVEKLQTLAIVELDPESAVYLEPLHNEEVRDCFISMMIVHPDSFINETR